MLGPFVMSSSFFTWFHYRRLHTSPRTGARCRGRGGITVLRGVAAPGNAMTLVCPKCGASVEMDLVGTGGTRMRLETWRTDEA
jgi:hypothetical protein